MSSSVDKTPNSEHLAEVDAGTSRDARRLRMASVHDARSEQRKRSWRSTPTEGVADTGELQYWGIADTGELRSGGHDRLVEETARAVEEEVRLYQEVCENERRRETADADEIERLESPGPTDLFRELRLMQSRNERSGEKSLLGDSRAGARYAREIEFAPPRLFLERTVSRGLSLLSENGGDEHGAHCLDDRPRPERPLGRAHVVGIHDERDRLQRAFGRAELEGHAALLAGLRLRGVLRRTSHLDAFVRDLGR